MKTPTPKRVRKVKTMKAWAVITKGNRIGMAYESYNGDGNYELCIYKDKSFATDNCCESFERVVPVTITYKP